MTSAMARLHRRLPRAQRYPLPPREIVETVAVRVGHPLDDEAAIDAATAAHFAYGAAAGAVIGAANVRPGAVAGAAAGVAVWVASYLGWLPGTGILKPAALHPRARNMLMIGAHLVWGVATARAMRELVLARETMLRAGALRDARQPGSRADRAGRATERG
ncbi:MAG: hypothetical protein JWN69_849 [Alphaproteobacteria bacterium]|nr:hypothetical protein [Alphaproteobacteria bacterium]